MSKRNNVSLRRLRVQAFGGVDLVRARGLVPVALLDSHASPTSSPGWKLLQEHHYSASLAASSCSSGLCTPSPAQAPSGKMVKQLTPKRCRFAEFSQNQSSRTLVVNLTEQRHLRDHHRYTYDCRRVLGGDFCIADELGELLFGLIQSVAETGSPSVFVLVVAVASVQCEGIHTSCRAACLTSSTSSPKTSCVMPQTRACGQCG